MTATAGIAGVGTGPSEDNAPGNISVAQTTSTKKVTNDANSTRCSGVVHIGDSTSEGLVSPEYLPNPQQRIAAQYGRVGATTQHLEISGARSIYERYEGQPNAYDVAEAWRKMGFHGCWVFALGTNEAANVAAGSTIDYAQRIDMMMSVANGGPVMWVNVRSLQTTGPYAEANMKAWDQALLRACNSYPNMRIYDWASDVKDSWFIDDGIHFTSIGYAARSKLIAGALLQAFPATGTVDLPRGSDCVIHHPDPPPAPPHRGSKNGKSGKGPAAKPEP